MISIQNDGTHDFGYPCSMPRTVTVEGLFVDDGNHPEDYSGLYLFADPDQGHSPVAGAVSGTKRPFPYAPCHTVRVRGLTTASGRKPRVSPNSELERRIAVIEEDAP
jgi:hypothetical protein